MTRSISVLLPLALLVGCAPAAVDMDFDSDEDGLMDEEEFSLGLDPENSDSDGDSFDDMEEVNVGTDPADPEDHPYLGGWPMDGCATEMQGTGSGEGDIAEDFELEDQFGDAVRFHDFCDHAVLLVSSATWCGACVSEAPQVQGYYEEYGARGFIAITLLGEDENSQPPDNDDLNAWAEQAGITHPVLADGSWGVSNRYEQDGGIPTLTLVAPGGELVMVDQYVTDADIEAVLPE